MDFYDVSILSRSDNLDCVIADEKGIVPDENITDIRITCQSWRVPDSISAYHAGFQSQISLDVAANGNAFVVWTGTEDVCKHIWSNQYTVGTGWGTPQRLSGDQSGSPMVAINDSGSAIAVWHADTDQTAYKIWSSQYTPDIGWSVASRIGNRIGGTSLDPVIAMDSDGNALIVWIRQSRQGNGESLWSSTYNPGAGWRDPAQIDTGDTFSIGAANVVFSNYGKGLTVWTRLEADGIQPLVQQLFRNQRLEPGRAGCQWGNGRIRTA